MRRTGFARKVYAPGPSAPLRPIENCRGVIRPVSGVVVATPKLVLLRSRAYREWVAAHECFACTIQKWSQAAHPNQAKYGKGERIKAGDQFCFPLCSTRPGHQGCHFLHDNCIDMTKDERDEIEDGYVQRMQAMARADGRKEFREAA